MLHLKLAMHWTWRGVDAVTQKTASRVRGASRDTYLKLSNVIKFASLWSKCELFNCHKFYLKEYWWRACWYKKFKPIYFTWIGKQAKPILIPLHGSDILRIFSTFFYGGGNRRTRRKPPCTVRVLITLPTYSQAEDRTRVAEVEGQSVAAQPTVHP